MAAQTGRLLLVYQGDGGSPESFVQLQGQIEGTVTIEGEPVDISNKDSNGWREFLEGRVNKGISIQLSGVSKDDVTFNNVRNDSLNNLGRSYQLVIPGTTAGATFEGRFFVTSYEESGAQDGAINYSITLASSGEPTIS